MVNYQNSKIYKIQSHLGDKVYIGSTTKQYLSQRMDVHRSAYKRWKQGKTEAKTSSFEVFDEYGVDNCTIVLLEVCPCNSKDESHAREAYYIKSMICVNHNMPNRTKAEWREANLDKTREYNLKYHDAHCEEKKEKWAFKKLQEISL